MKKDRRLVIEYIVILTVIVLVVIVVLATMGDQVQELWNLIPVRLEG